MRAEASGLRPCSAPQNIRSRVQAAGINHAAQQPDSEGKSLRTHFTTRRSDGRTLVTVTAANCWWQRATGARCIPSAVANGSPTLAPIPHPPVTTRVQTTSAQRQPSARAHHRSSPIAAPQLRLRAADNNIAALRRSSWCFVGNVLSSHCCCYPLLRLHPPSSAHPAPLIVGLAMRRL